MTGKDQENELIIDLRATADREGELLLHCARASVEKPGAERIRELVAEGLDWDRLLKLAQRNGLSPLLYFHLQRISAASVSTDSMTFLRDYFQKNNAFNVLLTGELASVLTSFKENGISAVPYKGPAIAVKLYRNLALRQFCDLDILVRECDVWKASELIIARGFEPHFLIPKRKRRAFVRLSYVQLFRRDAGRTLIELHWGIAPRFFSVRFDADAFWDRLEVMMLQGSTVSVPCAEDLLLLLCVHGAKDYWEKLEWVGAIAELIRSTEEFDWARVWQQSAAMRCRRMLVFGLLLAHALFEVPIPPQAALLSQSRKLRAMTSEVARDFFSVDVRPRPFLRRVRFHLRLKDHFADQVRHCMRLALTTTPVDWSMMSLPRPLSFAYSLLRAVRLTRKYGLNNDQASS